MHPFMNASMQLAASAFFVLSYEAEAQIAPTTHFGAGIYTGGSLPLADFTDSAKAGYHVGGTVDRTVNKFLDLRIDVAFNKLSDKTLSEGTTFREVGTNLLFGTLGAKVHPVRPFFQVGYHAIVSNGRQNDHNALMLASLGLQLR